VRFLGKVIAIASGKGGVGKTTIAANLGIELAKYGKKVLLLDADLPMPNLAMLMGVRETSSTLNELLAGEKDIKKAIYKTYNVTLLPSDTSLEKFVEVKMDNFGAIMKALKGQYDFILVDTPPGLNEYTLEALSVADEILLVVTPDDFSVADAVKLKTAASSMQLEIKRMLINRVPKGGGLLKRGSSKAKKPHAIVTQLGAEILGAIPDDKNVGEATHQRKPVVAYKPKCDASKAFRVIARRLLKVLA